MEESREEKNIEKETTRHHRRRRNAHQSRINRRKNAYNKDPPMQKSEEGKSKKVSKSTGKKNEENRISCRIMKKWGCSVVGRREVKKGEGVGETSYGFTRS